MLLVAMLAALSVNQEEIVLRFAVWQTPQPLSIFWWLLIAFVVGVLFGVLNGMWAGARRRLELRKLNKELIAARAEVERLRDITLKG